VGAVLDRSQQSSQLGILKETEAAVREIKLPVQVVGRVPLRKSIKP
jgi:hypothetical protein